MASAGISYFFSWSEINNLQEVLDNSLYESQKKTFSQTCIGLKHSEMCNANPYPYSFWMVSTVCVFGMFRIVNYTPDMSASEVDFSIEKALQVWAKVSPLTFTRIYSGNADIMVSFGARGNQPSPLTRWLCIWMLLLLLFLFSYTLARSVTHPLLIGFWTCVSTVLVDRISPMPVKLMTFISMSVGETSW